MKRVAIYPGTFDPITKGHIDIVSRCLGIFDRVIVAVAVNPQKEPLFSVERRLDFARESLKEMPGVELDSFDGLLVDYVNEKGGAAIVRGLRAISDFEFELQMALMNRRLDPGVETVFMMPSQDFSFLTSSMVKEVASYGGAVRGLVHEVVEEALKEVFHT